MNREMIKIGDTEIPVMEYDGQRVVTFEMIDDVHQRPDGTAGKRFSENKYRFHKGKHYFEVTKPEIRAWLEGLSEKRKEEDITGSYNYERLPPRQYLITERGYLLLVKSFTDDLAWEVQERLIEGYFRGKHKSLVSNDFIESLHPLAELLSKINKKQDDLHHACRNISRRVDGIETRMMEASALMMSAGSVLAGGICPDETRQVFTLEISPVTRFVEERCRIYPHTYIPCADLFAAFSAWCHEHNLLPLGRTRFYEQILKYAGVYRNKEQIGNIRRWAFVGIGLRG